MSMPIQRQSEQFSAFESGPRWERDKGSRDIPKGLAALINTSGPRIQAGLLNTRTAGYGDDSYVHPMDDYERELSFEPDYTPPLNTAEDARRHYRDEANRSRTRQAVNTEGMDPREHAYGGGAGDPLFGEFGHDGYDYEGVSRGEFRQRMRDYDPDAASAHRREEIEDEDDESGYNWGPVPPQHLGAVSEDYSGGDEDDPDWVRENSPRQQETNRRRGEEISISKDVFGSRHPFDRAAAARLAEDKKKSKCTCWEGYERVPGTEPCSDDSCRKKTSARRFRSFQWSQDSYDPTRHSDYEQKLYRGIELHKAPLENGHELHAWKYTDHPDDAEGWQWAITDPSREPSNHGRRWDSERFNGSPPPLATWLAADGKGASDEANLARKYQEADISVPHGHHINTVEEAMQQAQDHYQRMFPIGSSTGGHDSGTDYSDLNSYMRHLESMRLAAWWNGKPDHTDVSWEETDEGWRHPVTKCQVRPSAKDPDKWDMVAPTTSRRKPFSVIDRHVDPQAMMDRHDRETGFAPRTAALGIDDRDIRSGPMVDMPLYEQDPDDAFGSRPYSGSHCPDCGRPARWVGGPGCHHHHTAAAAPAVDPAQMQAPPGGGFLPGHRVAVDWRGQPVTGTVTSVEDPHVWVRYDHDGQHLPEEPQNLRLL